jgi:UDP-2,3-diacylglucosamine hydrolase
MGNDVRDTSFWLYRHSPRKVQVPPDHARARVEAGYAALLPPPIFASCYLHSGTGVVLFVSDMHLGRGSARASREHERALIDCLHAHADQATHLYLLGDVFDAYIEHRSYIPKQGIRLMGELAQWTACRKPVCYLHGNHDPWHLDFMDRELGVRVVEGPWTAHHYGQHIHLAHGDRVASTHGRWGQWMRQVMHHQGAVAAYRTLLPADWGLAAAQWVSRRLHGDPDPTVIRALRTHAAQVLRTTAADAVLMGHSHAAELHEDRAGIYLNTGTWYEKRTFVRLTPDRWALMQWNGAKARPIKTAPVSQGSLEA